jgi:3-demethoxyubiquinol 3-hydroxylase
MVDIPSLLRVNQAGEYGAQRIYAGQMAVMGQRHKMSGAIKHMAVQEEAHLAAFNAFMVERGVRPTLFQPFWHIAGYALGAATALLSPQAAMACTAAVETEIDAHYSAQIKALGSEELELKALIEEFRQEELEHRDTALAQGAEQAPAYPLMSAVIRLGCRVAIAVSRKI